jgi:hypothetical protein
VKTCECGCGGSIPLAKVNRPKDGLIKGQQSPARFLRGHQLRVVHPPWWKGEAVGYRAIHTYLQKHFPKTGICEECSESGKTDYALIKDREYSRDRADYRELCRSCHVAYDDVGAPSVRRRAGAAKRQEAGDPPACRCGCGAQVEWDANHGRWRSYRAGHYVGTARALRRAG